MSQSISPLQANLAKLTGMNEANSKAKDTQDDPLKVLLQAKQQADRSYPSTVRDANEQDAAFSPSAQGLQAAAASERYQQAYGYSQTMSLSLTTKEGDRVQVDFRQLYAEYQSYQHQQAAMEGPKGARYFESTELMEATAFEERFGFSVQGDLNEAELKAVFEVFDQVNELANQFFDGNIEEAFKQAQEMDVDFGQLRNVSLELQKTQVRSQTYQQAAAYQGVQQQAEVAGASEGEGAKVADLPPYLQKMQQVVATLDQVFEEARVRADELFAKVLTPRDPEQKPFEVWYDKVKSLHDQLAEMANLDKMTLKPSGVEIPTKVEENPAQTSQTKSKDADI